MTKRTTIAATAAALLLLPALLTACSSGGSGAGGDDTEAAGDNGSKTASCMRDKGYEMDDPADGVMTLAAPEGVDKEQWAKDLQKCLGDGPGGAGGFKEAGTEPGAAEKSREVAECMRDNGYEDYPDGLEEQSEYKPADSGSFDSVVQTCNEKVWGSDGETVDAG